MLKQRLDLNKRFFIFFLIPLISVVLPLSSLIDGSASALSGSEIKQQTEAWQTLAAIANAPGNNFKDKLSTSQIASCDFIKSGDVVIDMNTGATVSGQSDYSIAVGYTVSSGDGLWHDGSPPAGIQDGFKLIGAKDCTDFAKQLGYTVQGGEYASPGEGTIKSKANALGQRLAKNISVDGVTAGWGQMPNYMTYQALMSAFTIGCKASYRVDYTENDSLDTGHNSEQVKENQEAQTNGQTKNDGTGHYYINTYRDDKTVGLDTYFVSSDHFSSANIGYGLNRGEKQGTMGCTRQVSDNGGVVRWWLSQHDDFAKDWAAQVTKTGNSGDTATGTKGTGADDAKVESSCQIEGIGWLMCPVVRFIAKIVDASYGIVSNMLTTPPSLFDNTKGPGASAFQVWGVMRNFANVAFVIVFLIIIYSQLTSAGISNYGLKKMMPRLIIAAILVNTSYWLCAIAVDLSNILGGSLRDLTAGLGTQIYTAKNPGSEWDGLALISIGAGTAVAAAFAYVNIAIFLPMGVAALLAIITVVLVLTLRQAMIVILIIIAPLAFVAYLLPNTESLFKKWWGSLKILLLMYPIIALIFGGSALASNIISQLGKDQGNFILEVMGAGIAIIPLFITPIIMKTSSGLLSRFGGIINNPNKGPFDRMRKGAERYRDRQGNIMQDRRLKRSGNIIGGSGGALGSENSRRRKVGAWIAGAGVSAGLNADQKDANAKAALAKTQQAYVANRAGSDAAYAQMIAGPTGNVNQIQAAAKQALQKLNMEEVSAQSVLIKELNAPELETLAKGGMSGKFNATGNIALQQAAMLKLAKEESFEELNRVIDHTNGQAQDSKERRALADVLEESRPAYVGMADIQNIRTGNSTDNTASELLERALAKNAYSPEVIATKSAAELKIVGQHAVDAATPANLALRTQLIANANEALTNPELSVKLGKNLSTIEAINGGRRP